MPFILDGIFDPLDRMDRMVVHQPIIDLINPHDLFLRLFETQLDLKYEPAASFARLRRFCIFASVFK